MKIQPNPPCRSLTCMAYMITSQQGSLYWLEAEEVLKKMGEVEIEGGKSLALTPTWAVGTVITVMVALGFFFHESLKHIGKWLDNTKRKALLSALEKIKEELMLFGLMSLLMGHWIIFVAKICVKPSVLSSKFYPCALKIRSKEDVLLSAYDSANISDVRNQLSVSERAYCPEGRVSFASHESLEQLHRFMFVLGVTHVSYSFIAVVLAMIKIYSWRNWENNAKTIAFRNALDPETAPQNAKLRRFSTFIFHQTSHPWSQHKVLVWMLCFSRQFWSSISQADYMALRCGYLTRHQLPLTYDFHNYMLRSMEEEFGDIVGISAPLWIYAILCIFLDFHGTDIYFWLSFFPAILILLVGTKLHRVVVKLAVEVMHSSARFGNRQFNLRDELFWFGKPRLLLWLIQFISFQNAFEMATFLWSLWEIKGSSCFMDNRSFVIIRLMFGLTTQFWCSFITFPLYVIVTQMSGRFKKTVISENVRKSLHGWKRRVKARQTSTPLQSTLSSQMITTSGDSPTVTTSGDSSMSSGQRSSSASAMFLRPTDSHEEASSSHGRSSEISECNESNEMPEAPHLGHLYRHSYSSTTHRNVQECDHHNEEEDDSVFIHLS